MKKTIAALLAILTFCTIATVSFRSFMRMLYPHRYEELVTQYSEEYGVDADLIYAVMRTESSFDPDAGSNVGALGLMQIMPDTLDWLCFKTGEKIEFQSLRNPETSIRLGAYFLRLLQDEFGTDREILAAYHAGRGQVNKWLSDERYSKDGKTLFVIPFRDTAHYVSKVTRAKQTYKNLYKG